MKLSQHMKLGLVLGGVVLLAFLMNNYSSTKSMLSEGMDKMAGAAGVQGPLSEMGPFSSGSHAGGNAQPVESVQSRNPTSQGTYTETRLTPSELLPKGEVGASVAAVNPSAVTDLKGQNFLNAGYQTNTAIAGVSQSNRNPTYDIRAETPNPQGQVGPFLNTTIAPNMLRAGISDS
jgi:hypothetical protein